MYDLDDLLSEIILESPMTSDYNKKEFDRKIDVLNHWVDLSPDVKKQLSFTPEIIAGEYYQKYRNKLKVSKLSKKLLNLSDKYVEVDDINYNINSVFYNIYRSFTFGKFSSNSFIDFTISNTLRELLMSPVSTIDSIKCIYEKLNYISKNNNIPHDILDYLLSGFLRYKIGTLEAQVNITTNVRHITGGCEYYKTILNCIVTLYNDKSLMPLYIDDLSALVCLFLKELKINMDEDGFDTIFYNYFSSPINDIIRSRVIKFKNEDIIDLLDKITFRDFCKPILTDFKKYDNKKIDTNYHNDFISEEKLGEYLIFGPNIFRDLSDNNKSIYELIYKAYSYTCEDVAGLFNINESSDDTISSTLTSDDKIFLRLTEDLQIMDIRRKIDGVSKTLMKYKNIDDIFVAFKLENSKSILGISLLDKGENIMILYDDSKKYKFIYGKDLTENV